jgi:2'-phosphotransferase
MPRPADSPDVAASKTLAYILRHGAEKEGLHIRSDGLVRLDDVVSCCHPRAVAPLLCSPTPPCSPLSACPALGRAARSSFDS